jgi:pimeloyl-ACP methyl ester carboxylesterase
MSVDRLPVAGLPGHLTFEVSKADESPADPTPLLLVHGLNSSRGVWDRVLPALAANRTVVTLDLRGHGESSAPVDADYAVPDYAADVVAVIECLGFAQVDVLGTSLGGMVVQHAATERPDLVRSLLLVDTMCETPDGMDLSGLADAIEQDGVGKVMQEFVETKTFAPPARPVLIDLVMQTILAEPDDLVAARWRQADYHGRKRAAQIACPVLVVHGDRDLSVPLASGVELYELIESARLAVIPACGHMPFLEEPDRFVEEVARFLHDLVAPRGSPQ